MNFLFQISILIQYLPPTLIKSLPNNLPPNAIHCAPFQFIPIPGKNMEPTTQYLTLYPATSTTRSILAEPIEQRLGPVEQIQVPVEQTHVPLEQSQEAQKLDSVQKQRKQWEETIEQIIKLEALKTPWYKIGEAVGLSKETCRQMWHDYRRELEEAEAAAQPEPSRRMKPWSNSEDEILINLRKAGRKFKEMGAELEGRSASACRLRFERVCANAHHPSIVKTTAGNETREG